MKELWFFQMDPKFQLCEFKRLQKKYNFKYSPSDHRKRQEREM